MSAIPATPKTTHPASVFAWLTKHFGAAKAHVYRGDPNPYADHVLKDAIMDATGRAALTKHLRASSEWTESGPGYFQWQDLAIDLRRRGKSITFSAPKRAKARTIPYYD